jgi:hypothetical protein
MLDEATHNSSPLLARPYNSENTKHHHKPPPSAVPTFSFPYDRMADSSGRNGGGYGVGAGRRSGKHTVVIVASYVFDWIILIAAAVVGYILGNITPNKRPFNLEDPDISYAT